LLFQAGNALETLSTNFLPHSGSRNGFICQVGGDYRAKYGTIINEREVAITQYTGFSNYRVIYRKQQSPVSR
jgi:hypothetical protein